MAEYNLLGRVGEDIVVQHLEQHEYTIRHRNWCKGHLKLDIMATQNDEPVIMEVKTRADTDSALPQNAATPQKVRQTVITADIYIKLSQIDTPVRSDIVTAIGRVGGFRIEHIKETFCPSLL